ncbi:hypothetical protein protein [Bacillus cereus G9241]|nr:hypothetical protein protein [Bacillus cereus G9241]
MGGPINECKSFICNSSIPSFFNAYKTEFTMPSFGSVNVPSKSNKNVVYTFQSPTHFTL